MSFIIPLDLDAEYRGRVDSRDYDFTDRSTGERVQGSTAELLKFEYDVEGREGEQLTVSVRQLDGAAAFDVGTLKKGEYVRLVGFVNCAERGDDRGSRLTFARVERKTAKLAATG